MKYLDLKRVNEPYEHTADEVLRSGWYLRGEHTKLFEQHYAKYIGTRHCVGCGNGLDALTLIFRAYKEMGIMTDGDEVIVPANTYIASILAVTENRLVPVLVEPDIDTLQINDKLIEQAITPKTRALMIVHLYGRCAYTPLIGEVCRRHHLKLIEDNAQAHGCTAFAPYTNWQDDSEVTVCNDGQSISPQSSHRTGSLGHAAAHSFYPTKNLGAFGDAGAVTTDDAELASLIRAIGNYGSSRHYVFDYLGVNSRIDELQAAILDAKLPHLDADNLRRKAIAAVYVDRVSHPDVVIPHGGDRDSVWHIFPVLSARRDELRRHLKEQGVETEIHYPIPPYRQRCYATTASHGRMKAHDGSMPYALQELSGSFPITDRIHNEELSLPCHPAMTTDDALFVADLINNFI